MASALLDQALGTGAESRQVNLIPEASNGEHARAAEECGKVDDEAPEPEEKASARAITLNLITGGLGSAIFSLPWSIAGTSIIPGIIIIAIVMVITAWTISIIIRAGERTQKFDLGAIVEEFPGVGRPLMILTNVCVWISMFLCLVSYVIVIHDCAFQFVKGTIVESRLILVSLASVLVFPLCFLPQSQLEKTSSIAVGINIYLFVLVGFFYGQKAAEGKLPEKSCLLGGTVKGNFAMASVMFQAVIIQMCVLPMYRELEERSPEKFDKIVAVGFGVLFIIFCGFSSIAYLLFGPSVSADVLFALPPNAGSSIAQVGVILVVACVYPIMLYPMIAPLENITYFQGAMRMRTAKLVSKVIIVVAALFVALFVKSLANVNTFNGAASAALFVTILPVAAGLLLLDSGPCHKVALVVLLIVGLALAACGLVFEDNYVKDLKCYIET